MRGFHSHLLGERDRPDVRPFYKETYQKSFVGRRPFGPVLRRTTALAVLAALLLTGGLSPRPVRADSVHLDIQLDPYVAGESLTLRIFVSNPTDANVSFVWTNSCTLEGHVESERRSIGGWDPYGLCLFVVIRLQVPANSSVLFQTLTFDTRQDDGCIRAYVALHEYLVSGSAETCPRPAPPVPPGGPMMLVLSSPASARSGELFDFRVTARTLEGSPIEGIRVSAVLGDQDAGTTATGPDGIARMTARAPDVGTATLRSLLVRSSGPAWNNASRAANMLIFPPTARYLRLEASLATGDLLESGGVGMLDLVVRTSDGTTVANASVAAEPEGPLSIKSRTDHGGGRLTITLRAESVNESRVAMVRVVANAPGFDGTELHVGDVVLAPTPSTGGGPSVPLDEGLIPALLAVVAAAAVGAAAVLVGARTRWRKTHH